MQELRMNLRTLLSKSIRKLADKGNDEKRLEEMLANMAQHQNDLRLLLDQTATRLAALENVVKATGLGNEQMQGPSALSRSLSYTVETFLQALPGYTPPKEEYALRQGLWRHLEARYGETLASLQVLEWNPGLGLHLRKLKTKPKMYLGLEPSPVLLEYAKRSFASEQRIFSELSAELGENFPDWADLLLIPIKPYSWSVHGTLRLLDNIRPLARDKADLVLSLPLPQADLPFCFPNLSEQTKTIGWAITEVEEVSGNEILKPSVLIRGEAL